MQSFFLTRENSFQSFLKNVVILRNIIGLENFLLPSVQPIIIQIFNMLFVLVLHCLHWCYCFFALLSANKNHVIFHVNYLRTNCVYRTKRVYEEARYLFILSLDKTEGVLENSPKLTEVCMSLCKHSRCILFRI